MKLSALKILTHRISQYLCPIAVMCSVYNKIWISLKNRKSAFQTVFCRPLRRFSSEMA